MASREQKVAGSVVLAALGLAAAWLFTRKKSGDANGADAAPGCLLQAPQDFLIRQNYLNTPNGLAAAVAYRTEQYGYVKDFGDSSLNPKTPEANSTATTFFGLPVTLNKRVIASLKCVEAEIRAGCGTAYQPQSLSGLRTVNTYHGGGEISNHMYGIAIDVDPNLNPCCGCVGKWATAPQCSKAVSSEFERMAMPECWVTVFERYGWYWLGHDPMRDTMHFEFLGVPPPAVLRQDHADDAALARVPAIDTASSARSRRRNTACPGSVMTMAAVWSSRSTRPMLLV